MQSLEPRTFLAATPAQVLTPAIRQNLLNHLNISIKSSLQAKLTANNVAGFDADLLAYMQTRTGAHFFFDPADIGDYVTYINANLNTSDVIDHSNSVLNNLYPEQDSSQTYTVSVPADVDWDNTGYSSNPETIHTLNRQYHWLDLAMAYRLSGNTAYADKLLGQLGDWSAESPALADPDSPSAPPAWLPLNAAVRASNWVWVYSLMIGSAKWDKEANTLFLAKTLETGEYLYDVTPSALTSNHTLLHGQGLHALGILFPEFTEAGDWETKGRQRVFDSMDAQFFADGGHFEQSPGYSGLVIDASLETKLLDTRNGVSWDSARNTRLSNAIEAVYELLTPDGDLPAMGDTYRSRGTSLFLKANLVQGVTTWPAARPRTRDAWLYGPDVVDPLMSNPLFPALGTRPDTYELEDSGNYIFRSGSDANARQILFDAGPRGGGHGHLDLFNFELFGYGRPLISDPGLYKYDSSDKRNWAVSTRAHNTISIGGASHATLEGAGNPGIVIDQYDVESDHVQITAHHFGYSYLAGNPVVSRSIWYDFDGTMLVVDWVRGNASQQAKTSFLIPGTSTSRNLAQGWMRSTNPTGGNVNIQSLLLPGQAASYTTSNIFTSSNAPPNEEDPATQFFVYQTGTYTAFATLITAYNGTTVPDITAQWLTTPVAGEAAQIRLDIEGDEQDITFQEPELVYPGTDAATRGAFSDLKYDSTGKLHLAFYDRDTLNLKYTVRGTNGLWSAIQTIDAGIYCGYEPSMAIDSQNRVGIAYTNANQGDLKYAFFDGQSWTVQTVDSRGSTGHYPSLVFSRSNGPIISYFDKTKGDLRLASTSTTGWVLGTVDAGSIGTKDVGRHSQVLLDPSRPTASKIAIFYEDTGGGRYLYAVMGNLNGGVQQNGYTIFTVSAAPKLGGYTSLAFDSSNRPAMSWYDSAISGLRYASSSGDTFSGINFSASTVQTKKLGYYSNLYFDNSGKPNIFYFNRNTLQAIRAVRTGSVWAFTILGSGGREIHVTRYGNTVAYTNLDESISALLVKFL